MCVKRQVKNVRKFEYQALILGYQKTQFQITLTNALSIYYLDVNSEFCFYNS